MAESYVRTLRTAWGEENPNPLLRLAQGVARILLGMTPALRTPIVIDLIGDLDSTLVASLSEMLQRFTADGPQQFVVSARHLAQTTRDALESLASAIDRARERGASIAVDAGNRKMRQAFGQAKIDHSAADVPRPAHARHYMMARHAEKRHLLVA